MAKRRATYEEVKQSPAKKIKAWLSCFGLLAVSTMVIASSVALIMWVFAQVA